jgi:hypothetical protein
MSNYVPPTQPVGPAPAKKSNALTWILIGCGGLILIGAIVFAAVSFFLWKKAKETVEHPTAAVAKMIEMANPDVEVVSVDEGKNLITLKDKKTGKTVTMNFDEASKGKITFEGEGKKVTVESGAESLKVETDEGKMRIGGEQGAKLPNWLPPYPGVENKVHYSVDDDKEQVLGFGFVTDDPPNRVASFYEKALKEAGFRPQVTSFKEGDGASSSSVAAEDQAQKRSAFIIAIVEGGRTKVNVTLKMKK